MPQRYAKDNRTANFTARSDKSVTYVTSNKRLYSTLCTVEANYWQTRSIAQPLCDSRATCQSHKDNSLETSALYKSFTYLLTKIFTLLELQDRRGAAQDKKLILPERPDVVRGAMMSAVNIIALILLRPDHHSTIWVDSTLYMVAQEWAHFDCSHM